MPPEISVNNFSEALAKGAYAIDVREVNEYVEGHVPGIRLMPVSRFSSFLEELPKDRTIYVICRSGNRSSTAANYLTMKGFDAVSVSGGTVEWIKAGKPVAVGMEEG